MGVKEEIEKDLGSPIVKALDEKGLTPAFLARKLKAELHAKETKVFLSKAGEIKYSDPLVAWDVRQKARQDAHKLRGDYPAERKQVGGLNGEPIRLIIEDMSKKKPEDSRDALAPVEKELIDEPQH